MMQILDQVSACDAVQRREGLIEKQQVRVGDQGAGDRHAHGHAARELARVSGQTFAETNGGQGDGGAIERLIPRHASKLQRQGHIGAGVGPGHQCRRLEDEGGAACGGGCDEALGRALKACEEAERRRLAGAGSADEGDDLARLDRQVQRSELSATRIANDDVREAGDRASVHHGRGRADTGS